MGKLNTVAYACEQCLCEGLSMHWDCNDNVCNCRSVSGIVNRCFHRQAYAPQVLATLGSLLTMLIRLRSLTMELDRQHKEGVLQQLDCFLCHTAKVGFDKMSLLEQVCQLAMCVSDHSRHVLKSLSAKAAQVVCLILHMTASHPELHVSCIVCSTDKPDIFGGLQRLLCAKSTVQYAVVSLCCQSHPLQFT